MATISEARTTEEVKRMDAVPMNDYVLDDQVVHLVRRAHQKGSALFLSVLTPDQLTPTQFFAMARLFERGKLSQNRLGRLAAMDPATIQGVIRRLEERGFIQRVPDPTDRRRMLLSLTPSGEATVVRLLEGAHKVSRAMLAPLKPDEQQAFMDMLRRIV